VSLTPNHAESPPRGTQAASLIAVLLAALFLVSDRARRDRLGRRDVELTLRLQRLGGRRFHTLMRAISWPGFTPQSRVMPFVLAAFHLVRGDGDKALFSLAAWGASAGSTLIKRAVRRPRPADSRLAVFPAKLDGASFPSGHVIAYTSMYGFQAYLASRSIRCPGVRGVVVGALVSLIALVGPSRVYLGHHWFTDVLAGYLYGAAYLLGLIAVYEHFQRRKR
jgi:undecaprenyl-diphosphatase